MKYEYITEYEILKRVYDSLLDDLIIHKEKNEVYKNKKRKDSEIQNYNINKLELKLAEIRNEMIKMERSKWKSITLKKVLH